MSERCIMRSCHCATCNQYSSADRDAKSAAHERRIAACQMLALVLTLAMTEPMFPGCPIRDQITHWERLTEALALHLDEPVEQVRARYKRAEVQS